jgi:hypothetical protein
MSTAKQRRLQKEKIKLEKDGVQIIEWRERNIQLVLPTCQKILKIDLGEHYPFYCPEIWVDSIPYKHYLELKPIQIPIFMEIQKDHCCLLCSSFACKHNWTVIKTIHDIILDVETRIKWKNDIEILHEWKQTQHKFSLTQCLKPYLV